MILWNIYFKKYKYFIFWTISLPRWLRHSLHMIYHKCYRYNQYYFQSGWLINGITEEMSSLWPLIMFWLWQKQVALFKIILVSWFYFNCEKQPNWYGGVRVSNISCPIKNYLISWFYCNSERQPNWYAGQNPTGKDKSSGPIQNLFQFLWNCEKVPNLYGGQSPTGAPGSRISDSVPGPLPTLLTSSFTHWASIFFLWRGFEQIFVSKDLAFQTQFQRPRPTLTSFFAH